MMNFDDVRVVKFGHHTCFVEESLPERGIIAKLFWQNFKGVPFPMMHVLSQENSSHSARADFFDYPIVTELSPNILHHGRLL
jgi:hypothetical protein